MNHILLVVVVICTLFSLLVNGLVHKVASYNIDSITATHDLVILNFCVSWSSLCKEIASEYENASNVQYPVAKIYFGTVDAKSEPKLRTQYNVWSYPHIIARKSDGTTVPYRGRVDSLGIASFVKRAVFTSLLAMISPAQIEEYLHFEDVAVMGIFQEDKKEYHNYLEIAKRLQPRILIGFTTNWTYWQSTYQVERTNAAVFVYKRFQNSLTVYKSDFSIKVLANWISEATKLPVNFLQPENAFKYLGFKVPGVLLFLDTLNSSATTLTRTKFQRMISLDSSTKITTIQNSSPPLSAPTNTQSTNSTSNSPSPARAQNPELAVPTTNPQSTSSPSTNPPSTSSSSANLQSTNSPPAQSQDTNPSSISSPPSSQNAQSTTTQTTNTIYTPDDSSFGITNNIAENNIALRSSDLLNRECTGDFLNCLAMLHELAPLYKGNLNFIYTDGLTFQPFMNKLGLDKIPSVVILDWSQEKHYLLDPTHPITPATLHTFFTSFFANQLVHYVRSAPPPPPSLSFPTLVLAEGNSTRLVHVVADTFKELVLDSKKYVVLNIHLPWCGYCKSVWPAYEKLASLILDDNIVIADFDASINDMPRDFSSNAWPTHFPHITLFRPNNNTPIALIKELSLENMVEFLSENIPGFVPASTDFKVKDPFDKYLHQTLT